MNVSPMAVFPREGGESGLKCSLKGYVVTTLNTSVDPDVLSSIIHPLGALDPAMDIRGGIIHSE